MSEFVELMNMCMITDKNGRVLVQDRKKKDWNGLTFPGGKVEPGESLTHAVIRGGLMKKQDLPLYIQRFAELRNGMTRKAAEILCCFTEQKNILDNYRILTKDTWPGCLWKR